MFLLLFVFLIPPIVLAFIPRIRITTEKFQNLKEGMTLYDANKVIGLRPGLYDGVVGFSGVPWSYPKNDIYIAEWVDRNAAIHARLEDVYITEIGFVDQKKLKPEIQFSSIIHDRLIRRVYESKSLLATFTILIYSILLGILPIVFLFAFLKSRWSDIVTTILIGVSGGYLAYVLLNGRFAIHHAGHEFNLLLAFQIGFCYTTALAWLLMRVIIPSAYRSFEAAENKVLDRVW